jgi:hypothetical protein
MIDYVCNVSNGCGWLSQYASVMQEQFRPRHIELGWKFSSSQYMYLIYVVRRPIILERYRLFIGHHPCACSLRRANCGVTGKVKITSLRSGNIMSPYIPAVLHATARRLLDIRLNTLSCLILLPSRVA